MIFWLFKAKHTSEKYIKNTCFQTVLAVISAVNSTSLLREAETEVAAEAEAEAETTADAEVFFLLIGLNKLARRCNRLA